MPKDFLATPVAPAAAAAVQGGAAAEAMRGALGGFRDAMGTGHAELDETFAAQQKAQGGQEGMLSGLQRIEEAKLLARKAEAALVPVGGGSAAALQLQRNALESLDAAEQMA